MKPTTVPWARRLYGPRLATEKYRGAEPDSEERSLQVPRGREHHCCHDGTPGEAPWFPATMKATVLVSGLQFMSSLLRSSLT
jgi:hypothetical protein